VWELALEADEPEHKAERPDGRHRVENQSDKAPDTFFAASVVLNVEDSAAQFLHGDRFDKVGGLNETSQVLQGARRVGIFLSRPSPRGFCKADGGVREGAR
jgi:hypothetical protein